VALETLEYDYNIRGWLLGTNRGYLSGSGDHFFGLELSYDKRVSQSNGQVGNTYQSALYNGNIGGTVWRSKTEESRRFQYDYFVKDHLGNVRMVLAEERKVEVYPIASMEGDLSQGSSPVSVSKLFYDIEDSKVVLNPNTSLSYANNNGSIPTRQDASQTNQTSQKVCKLKATGGLGADLGGAPR
jgi:hypothetical protein